MLWWPWPQPADPQGTGTLAAAVGGFGSDSFRGATGGVGAGTMEHPPTWPPHH